MSAREYKSGRSLAVQGVTEQPTHLATCLDTDGPILGRVNILDKKAEYKNSKDKLTDVTPLQ